jgi:hypothetical protein
MATQGMEPCQHAPRADPACPGAGLKEAPRNITVLTCPGPLSCAAWITVQVDTQSSPWVERLDLDSVQISPFAETEELDDGPSSKELEGHEWEAFDAGANEGDVPREIRSDNMSVLRQSRGEMNDHLWVCLKEEMCRKAMRHHGIV